MVLDAGCGSGRITRELADRVPRGTVYAVDAAPSMVRHARAALGDRAVVLCQDLAELALPEPVDIVFSNATFHWIPDHPALFGALHRNMKPDARLVAQCGGRGNINSFRVACAAVAAEEPFAPYFAEFAAPWNYATPEESELRLAGAGFEQVSCWLEDRPVTLTEPRSFVETVCLVRHLDPLPARLREPFIDRVLDQLDDSRTARSGEAGSRAGGKREGVPLVLDYVRLNMLARRV